MSSNYLILLAIVGFFAYELFVVLRARKKITLRMSVPSRWASFALIMVIVLIAVLRRADFADAWFNYVGVTLLALLYVIAPVGLGEEGVYASTRLVRYEKLHYFAFDDFSAPQTRLHISRGMGSEIVFLAKKEQYGQIHRMMSANRVATIDAYKEQVRPGRK